MDIGLLSVVGGQLHCFTQAVGTFLVAMIDAVPGGLDVSMLLPKSLAGFMGSCAAREC